MDVFRCRYRGAAIASTIHVYMHVNGVVETMNN